MTLIGKQNWAKLNYPLDLSGYRDLSLRSEISNNVPSCPLWLRVLRMVDLLIVSRHAQNSFQIVRMNGVQHRVFAIDMALRHQRGQ